MLAFDGLMSCLRSYHPAELKALGEAAGPDYTWTAGRLRVPSHTANAPSHSWITT